MAFTLASALEHQRRRTALVACGLDPDLAMARGASYANEVWIGEAVVLRVNWRGVGRLEREARIVGRVARAARVPEILAVGNDGEIEWMLARRAPGIELGRAWAAMTTGDRERAIHELAGALAAVHETPTADIPDDIRPPHTLPLAALIDLIDGLRADHEPSEDPDAERQILDDCEAFVRARWHVFDDAGRGLVHGDPHLENVLWDGAHVSALLDLEWSRPSWIHADLETLLAVADHPALFASADHEHSVDRTAYADVPRWLAAAQPAWFAHPRLLDRLLVLHVSRTLGHFEDGFDAPIRWEHLRAVLDGTSYLHASYRG